MEGLQFGFRCEGFLFTGTNSVYGALVTIVEKLANIRLFSEVRLRIPDFLSVIRILARV